tara:strand:- start:939 stop:2033 length:1095 start_codon:yes stop_codon:yes gene_type:complete
VKVPSKTIKVEGRFDMRRGGFLESPVIAYETWGTLVGEGENAIILFTGLSPSAHAASSPDNNAPGWWESMIGPRLPLDTDQFFIICINSLGSCFGSTGPASINPRTGDLYRVSFPVLTLEDVAQGGFEVVKALGLTKVHTTIGCSMGGMTALSFCAMHPDLGGQLLSISSATSAIPFSIAVRSLQREMIVSDPKWEGGNYDLEDPPIVGQRLARKLGMMTYRSPEEWEQRFGRASISTDVMSDEQFFGDFSIESYLVNHAEKFTGQFDANCYLYLSRASDLFDFSEHGGSLVSAFGKLKLERAMVVGVETDVLFPLRQQQNLARGLAAVIDDTELVRLDCIKGHDSFLVDTENFAPVITRFIQS